MSIKIIPDDDIYISQAQSRQYHQEYKQLCMYMVDPPSFEEFIQQKIRIEKMEDTTKDKK